MPKPHDFRVVSTSVRRAVATIYCERCGEALGHLWIRMRHSERALIDAPHLNVASALPRATMTGSVSRWPLTAGVERVA